MKIKMAFSFSSNQLTKTIKSAIISSGQEIVDQKHNKQFPLSILSQSLIENVNNNINEVIQYLVFKKTQKRIELQIFDFNNSPIDIIIYIFD
jgi:fumarate hydratase class II